MSMEPPTISSRLRRTSAELDAMRQSDTQSGKVEGIQKHSEGVLLGRVEFEGKDEEDEGDRTGREVDV